MKRYGNIFSLIVGVLIACLVTLSVFSPTLVDAAQTKCTDEGWQEQNLTLLGFTSSGGLFGRSGRVEFTATNKNVTKTIKIELRKPMFAIRWQVIRYDEKTPEDQELPII